MMAPHTPLFDIQNLKVEVEGREILKDFTLKINRGEVHALMGRNGSGKTTLSNTLMGHPKYKVTAGSMRLEGEEISGLSPDERAKRRLFLCFQYPVAIPGVTVSNFLRTSLKAVRGQEIDPKDFRKIIKQEIQALGIPESFMTRSMNDGFSGGEKKRLETLQMRLLQPKVAILDEADSGLDVDALRAVAKSVDGMRGPDRGILVITHYQRLLDYITPDYVHILMDGRIVKSGTKELALEVENKGYDWIQTGKNNDATTTLTR